MLWTKAIILAALFASLLLVGAMVLYLVLRFARR